MSLRHIIRRFSTKYEILEPGTDPLRDPETLDKPPKGAPWWIWLVAVWIVGTVLWLAIPRGAKAEPQPTATLTATASPTPSPTQTVMMLNPYAGIDTTGMVPTVTPLSFGGTRGGPGQPTPTYNTPTKVPTITRTPAPYRTPTPQLVTAVVQVTRVVQVVITVPPIVITATPIPDTPTPPTPSPTPTTTASPTATATPVPSGPVERYYMPLVLRLYAPDVYYSGPARFANEGTPYP